MGKIKKTATSRHDASISPAFSKFIKKLSAIPVFDIPAHLATLSTRWPYPRGDLYHWIAILNRFDDILQDFNAAYGLNVGPQTIPFGVSQLLQSDKSLSERRLKELGFGPEGDRELVESILGFTRLLLEKCGNRSLYNSSERLNELLNSTSLSLLHSTLRVALCLAQRYRERVRAGMLPAPIPSAYYHIEIERLQKLSAPIPQPPVSSHSPTSPIKTAKGKERSIQKRRTSQSANPNDFRALCKTTTHKNGSSKITHAGARLELEWQEYAHVQIRSPNSDSSLIEQENQDLASIVPDSPTPVRRHLSSMEPGTSQSPLSTSQNDIDEPSTLATNSQTHEVSATDFQKATVEQLVERGCQNLPEDMHYELLHKLRTAYGLITSSTSRTALLAVRLLAISNLACVIGETSFQQKMFGPDQDPAKRQLLVQQLTNLLHDGTHGSAQIPYFIQTLSMETLSSLARQKLTAGDVFTGLGISSNHGILLLLTQRCLSQLNKDDESANDAELDEWRESVFSMLKTNIETYAHMLRPADVVAAPPLISLYVDVLRQSSQKAMRVHLKVLETLKTYIRNYKDGAATLANNSTFEVAAQLTGTLVKGSKALADAGHGFPEEYKTSVMDYKIPYLHQRVLQSLLDFFNDISSSQAGAHADRIVRSLIDSPVLLEAYRDIIEHGETFGSYTWSVVVKCITSFLHNEPTSYAVIAEAGLSRSLLQSVTLTPIEVPMNQMGSPTVRDPTAPADDNAMHNGLLPRLVEPSRSNDSPDIVSSEPPKSPQGILPAIEAIRSISQAFGAVCLTNAGYDLFQASRVLPKFFEIFESPAHLKAMRDESLVQDLGGTFDELVRHHPHLRADVLSAVMVVLARVGYICRAFVPRFGAGPKLWMDKEGGGFEICGGNSALLPDATMDPGRSSQNLKLPNGKELCLDFDVQPASDFAAATPQEKDEHGLSVGDYINPALGFLYNFFYDNPQPLCSDFMETGGTDLILILLSLPCLPLEEKPNYPVSRLVHMMAETKPHLVLPHLLGYALRIGKPLHDFIQKQPTNGTCYFSALTTQSPTSGDPMDLDKTVEDNLVLASGTAVVRRIHMLSNLTCVLSAAFSDSVWTTARNSPGNLFTRVNLADQYAEYCQMLGQISAACTREELALRRPSHDEWLPHVPEITLTLFDPRISDFSTEQSRPNVAPEEDSATPSEDLPARDDTTASADPTSLSEAESASSKNSVLRQLFMQLPFMATRFLSVLGNGLVRKRNPDLYQKQNMFVVANAIATALLTQLDPYFFKDATSFSERNDFLDSRFTYLAAVLNNVKQVLLHVTSHPEHSKVCVTIVLLAFKNHAGLKTLTEIGLSFFEQLKLNQTAPSFGQIAASADSGLRTCLEIFDRLTSAKCIIESSQSVALKTSDPAKPFYFIPAQLLLELRMESMPLTRAIWNSEYAEHASKPVVERLVAILKHVMNGEQENEAHKAMTSLSFNPQIRKRFTIEPNKLNLLKSQDIDEGLASEALYRCHNSADAAEEYCAALKRSSWRQSNPIPSYDVESASNNTHFDTRNGSIRASPVPGASNTPSRIVSTPVPPTLNSSEDAAADSDPSMTQHDHQAQSTPSQAVAGETSGMAISSPMSISNVLNSEINTAAPVPDTSGGSESQSVAVSTAATVGSDAPSTPKLPLFTVEMVNAVRESIREDLVDRCLNLLTNHDDITWELSDLITSATRKLHGEAATSFGDSTCEVLINSLLSLQTEEITEADGKRIAACAHLTALQMQDPDMYKRFESLLQETFEALLAFIKIPPHRPQAPEIGFPWIGRVLLIVERMLSRDAEPAVVKWTPPTELEKASPATFERNEVLDIDQKRMLFDAIVNILPRIGKDRSLALSAIRALVILTRERQIAVLVAEKRNIQRLFVMMKQLAGEVDERIQSAFMLILRHVIEDDDILRQIMSSEIIAAFSGRNSGQLDTTAYIRDMYHLVLRSPRIFVEVTNEKLKIQYYDAPNRPQHLSLKPAEVAKVVSKEKERQNLPEFPKASGEGNNLDSVESDEKAQKVKSGDARPPVVEHPDGIIHFLLAELLAYKDVEDKFASPTANGASAANGSASKAETSAEGVDEADASPEPSLPGSLVQAKSDKQLFKAEEHPIFIYRCFLLQCLTELLSSYNRTKIEFINFSRRADPLATTPNPSKPRAGVLNYLLNALLPIDNLEQDDSIIAKKRFCTAEWTIRVIVALCLKTAEFGLSPSSDRYTTHLHIEDNDDEPDLAFVRRFVLEHAIKAFKDATNSTEPAQVKYTRMVGLAELFYKMLSKPSSSDGSGAPRNLSYVTISRMMFEKNLISILTASLAEISLSYSGAKRIVKHILRPLHELTVTASHLSLNSTKPITSALGTVDEDEISSASSVSEVDNDREATPDLFRNSTLGMLEPDREEESSGESEDEDDEDEEMYEEEYEDETDYEAMAMGPNDGEVVSDEELDGHPDGAGSIEGLPGDVPMDLERVIDNGNMDIDIDSEDDEDDDGDEDDEDDDTDSEEDDDDDVEEDFLIGADEDIMEGEINGDNDNGSLEDGAANEAWLDDEQGEDDFDEEEPAGGAGDVLRHIGHTAILQDGPEDTNTPLHHLNTLLQVVGEAVDGAANNTANELAQQMGADSLHGADEDDQDDDDEGDDDEMDEDQDDYVNDMLEHAAGDWGWDEATPFSRRNRYLRPSRHMPHNIFGRHPRPGADMGAYHRRHQAAPREAADGTNPLLYRQRTPSHLIAGGMPPSIGFNQGIAASLSGLGPSELIRDTRMLDAIMEAATQTHGNRIQEGPIEINPHNTRTESLFQAVMRGEAWISALPTTGGPIGVSVPTPRMTSQRFSRQDLSAAVSFTVAATSVRWQEEARLLFGSSYLEKIQRIVNAILAVLVPPAQEEERSRLRKLEEARKLEEEQRIERERVEKEEAERQKKEDEEKAAAAAALAAAAAAAAEAEIAAARAQEESSNSQEEPSSDAMEDIQATAEATTSQDAEVSAEPTTQATRAPDAPAAPQVFTTIRGRQLDITGLAIDAEYLEALPEELREEVIMQQYAEQRSQAQETGDASGFDPDFLDALPDDIREEIRQQEEADRRRRDRDALRRQAAEAGGPAQPEEMDNDSFLATLDPALRRAILAEQPEGVLASLDPRHAAEGRAHARQIFQWRGAPDNRIRDDRGSRSQAGPKNGRPQIVQMIDKAGVATLLRLMFLPQQGSLRGNLSTTLRNVCGHRQTRFDVVSTLLLILKEGSTDVSAVERSLANLSLRAKAAAAQKTPIPLKRTLSVPAASSVSEEMTPLTVIQQCLDTLNDLSRHDTHMKSIFLREADLSAGYKSKIARKGKGKENRASKFPINDLISLLDRKLIMESSTCLRSFSELLVGVTSPLVLLKKAKEESSKVADAVTVQDEASTSQNAAIETVEATVASPDAVMAEAGSVNETAEEASVETQPAENSATQPSEEAPVDASKPTTASDETQARKLFDPPTISEHNLQLVVGMLVARDGGRDTFNCTLGAIVHLSNIPGASEIFSKELISQAQGLSQAILTDLDELLPQIRDAQSVASLHGIATSKFSPASSEQANLLRVLTALDYLSEPNGAEAKEKDENDPSKSLTMLNVSYESLELGPLWTKLSGVLVALREKEDMADTATMLLPLIESLLLVCKKTPLKDAPIARQIREHSASSPVLEPSSNLEELFFSFTTEHRKILNEIVRQNPKLMQGGSFSILVKNPKVLEFDNKRSYFNKQIHSRHRELRHPQPPLQLSLRRDQVFLDSFRALYFKSAEEIKYGKLSIRFHGEEGVDAGGVTREWFQVLARGMFNPDYALFTPVASDRTTFHPNRLSGVNNEHLTFFKFIGRIIGKALHEGRVLDCHFSRAVYKRLLGKTTSLRDMETLDLEFYKSLLWILENDITDILTETFSVVSEDFGEERIIDLIENGRNIPVTEENKQEYVQLVVEYKLTGSVKEQLESFLGGFHDIIPEELISIFNEQELELLISGLPDVNVEDWKANTEYHNYNSSSPQIQWLWRLVKSMDGTERAKLLQFITGTSKVPLNGFKELEGMHGFTKFNIHKEYGNKDRLPSSHTCFNQLDLPEYDNYETLKARVLTAINTGADYFGFA